MSNTVDKPQVAVGHVSLSVSDIDASYKFYVDAGLRPFAKDKEIAILEMAGGTHLILFPRGGGDEGSARSLDLMIAGRTLEELEGYRARLVASGVAASPIPQQKYFGHYRFSAADPDGHEITVFTSHASDLPV
jgi:catechol 2,3-dioxygenase-like lactoylglutathione lyase family enzyme